MWYFHDDIWSGFVNSSDMTFLWGTHRKMLFEHERHTSKPVEAIHSNAPKSIPFGQPSVCNPTAISPERHKLLEAEHALAKGMKWRLTFLGCLSGHLNLWCRRTERAMSLGHNYQPSVFSPLGPQSCTDIPGS